MAQDRARLINIDSDAQPQVQQTQVRARQLNVESFLHAIVVLVVVLCATVLRARGALDTASISTVYGAAIGYAAGLVTKRSPP